MIVIAGWKRRRVVAELRAAVVGQPSVVGCIWRRKAALPGRIAGVVVAADHRAARGAVAGLEVLRAALGAEVAYQLLRANQARGVGLDRVARAVEDGRRAIAGRLADLAADDLAVRGGVAATRCRHGLADLVV